MPRFQTKDGFKIPVEAVHLNNRNAEDVADWVRERVRGFLAVDTFTLDGATGVECSSARALPGTWLVYSHHPDPENGEGRMMISLYSDADFHRQYELASPLPAFSLSGGRKPMSDTSKSSDELLTELGRAFSANSSKPGRANEVRLDAAIYAAVLRGQDIWKERHGGAAILA